MRIDAASGAAHRAFRADPELLQLSERGLPRARVRDRRKVTAQREQAAHECRGVHVVMTARVERRDESWFRRAHELRMQARDSQSAELTWVRIGGSPP